MLFLSSADFFQNRLFRKILSGIPSECQTVWVQIRLDMLSKNKGKTIHKTDFQDVGRMHGTLVLKKKTVPAKSHIKLR